MIQKIALFSLLLLTAAGCTEAGERTEVIAHRGYWKTDGLYENTLSSLKNAMALGIYGSEFDVWITADSVPVVHHDEKTANGIAIEEVTLEQLRAQADTLPNGEVIPTLAEYLETWNHDPIRLILEIKTHKNDERNIEAVRQVLKTVNEYGAADGEIEYIAFSRTVTEELIRQGKGAVTSYLEGDLTPQELKDMGCGGMDYEDTVLLNNPEWIEEAKKLKLNTNTWTVNDEESMRYFIGAGIGHITTNEPARLKKLLKRSKPKQ